MLAIEELYQQGEQLFTKRGGLLSLWQEIADNFYPERADFTTVRNLGADFASNLTTSYPILVRRDLGNALSTMLRPTSKKWKHIRTSNNWEKLSTESKRWLEWADARHSRGMFARTAQFTRATKQADHDFTAFGQAVLQVSLNTEGNGLLFRCWHLRDVVWVEDNDGAVCTVYRKWKPSARTLKSLFKNVHPEVTTALEKDPYKEFDVWHIVTKVDYYDVGSDKKKFRTKYVSIYYDVANKHVMEEVGVKVFEYIIPRWQTVSGSQYAYSPATVAGLPDARLIQSITAALLDAGEKASNPPMIGVQEALRSDIALYAGGFTAVDANYDERMGEVLRPISQDYRGISYGLDMARDTRAMIMEAFFLNKLSLPAPGTEMTAYEVGQRVQEYIRQAMPLFEPIEYEYNAPLCEASFEIMLNAGAFGSALDVPRELQGENYEFHFESPLHDAVEREKGQRFLEAGSMLAQVVQLDPTTRHVVNARKALRDVLESIGVPAAWTNSEDEVNRAVDAEQQQQQSAALLAQMEQGANVAAKLSEASAAAPSAATPSPIAGIAA